MVPRRIFGSRKPTKADKRRTKMYRRQIQALSKPQKRQVISLVRGQAETKRATFYQTLSTGAPPPTVATGLYSGRGWALQNNLISSNVTDILQLIPYVTQGSNDFERIGQRIKPVSLIVKGALRVAGVTAFATGVNTTPINIHVNIYVLQHVSLKNYAALRASNDFNQLLQTGEGTTTSFLGEALSPALPVAKQYYKVLARKTITLKYAGNESPVTGMNLSVANAHSWYAEYTLDLTKHLPASLMYPEATFPLPNPTVDDAPANSSIFMAMGYVDELNVSPPTTAQSQLEQTYVASLLYKDM